MILDAEYREIVRSFFELKILQINIHKPFILASGREAPVYIDHRPIFSDPMLRKRVVNKWVETLEEEGRIKNDSTLTFAGVATAGIAPAYALAERFQASFVYVRAQNKDHGTGKAIEGSLPPNATVIVVDDMITTGRSVLKVVETLRAEGANVIAATSISRHDFRSTNEEFQKVNVLLYSVFRTTDIFDIAYNMGLIGSKEMRAVMQWMTQENINVL